MTEVPAVATASSVVMDHELQTHPAVSAHIVDRMRLQQIPQILGEQVEENSAGMDRRLAQSLQFSAAEMEGTGESGGKPCVTCHPVDPPRRGIERSRTLLRKESSRS